MSVGIQIDKDIPVPPSKNGKVGRLSESIKKLEVGHSIFFAAPASRELIARNFHEHLGAGNYTLRKVEGGLRGWRTK